MEIFKQDTMKIIESYKAERLVLFEKLEAVHDKFRLGKYTRGEFDNWRVSLCKDCRELADKKAAEIKSAIRRYEPRHAREAASITGDQPDMKLLELKLTQEEFDVIAERNKHNRGMVIALKGYINTHPFIHYDPPMFGTAAMEAVNNIADNAVRYMRAYSYLETQWIAPFDIEKAKNPHNGTVM